MTATPDLTAHIPHHRHLPPQHDEADLVDLYLDRSHAPRGALHTNAPTRPWVRANMVGTIDGAVTGADNLSGSISSAADKRVFSVLRSLVDAVVVGAGTARAERYTRLHAKPRHADQREQRGQAAAPLLVLISRTGQFDLDRITAAGSGDVLVHAVRGQCTDRRSREITERLGTEALILHDDIVKPAGVLHDLRQRHCREILHEGGPQLLSDWVRAGVIDELCLTTSPLLVGAPGADSPRGLLGDYRETTPRPLSLLSLVSDGTTLIQRWGLPVDENLI